MFCALRRALCCLFFMVASIGQAQSVDAPIQELLQAHGDVISKGSRKTIQPAIDALASSDLAEAQTVLQRWQAKELWRDKDSGLFVFAEEIDRKTIRIFDVADGSDLGEVEDKAFKQLKPNSGVRSLIGSALVQFQLNSPDAATRATALKAIERDAEASHLPALRASIETETDPNLKQRKQRLERLLTIEFGETESERITAIDSFSADLGVDLRAALTPLTTLRMDAAETLPDRPDVSGKVQPGSAELSKEEAYAILVNSGLATPLIDPQELRETLIANIDGNSVAGVQVASLNTNSARQLAYDALVKAGKAEPGVTANDIEATLAKHTFYQTYIGAPPAVAKAAQAALSAIEARLAINQTIDLILDALSLGSIYFLAAIGLAITFGVMRVINMAHGEFIMMGAYTGYVVQQIIPDYTVSILVALPTAFAITFAAGVAMERLVIRHLYHRPLETLLATFGISIALQQLAKNIFGTQARPLTSPDWLDGSLFINDVVSISYIRIAIFVLALLFLALFLIVMNRTRLGLEVRAVTQNPRMAASMGINPDRINMLTFGFGSGIAGIAGVAIGLYAKVTSEMGADYIVQSFMTVVVGGVGNIWGTLLGATLVGTLQKGIEWLNPSNTLAAQTYMILFIILFIQFRPRGIIALKGRAAEA